MLYIPKRWLHDIESQTSTISISCRFIEKAIRSKKRETQFFKASTEQVRIRGNQIIFDKFGPTDEEDIPLHPHDQMDTEKPKRKKR